MMFGTELVLAAALLGPAQQPQKSGDVGDRYARAFREGAQDNPAVYEDIEIMRQLLARKLASFGVPDVRPLYGPRTSSGGSHNGQPNSPLDGTVHKHSDAIDPYLNAMGASNLANPLSHRFAWVPTPEGAYLDRIGAVFTVTLPSQPGDQRPRSGKPDSPPAGDEWERTRKELRGEKSDASSAEPSQPPTVGDVILRTLAENGKHFRSLGADEKLTVVVTFRSGANQPHSPWYNYPPVTTQAPTQNPASFTLSGGGTVTLGGGSSANDLELLADLHLKQQQYDQALEVLGKAVATVSNELKQNPSKGAMLRLAALHSKEAQAFLATGKVETARAALERAAKLSQETTGTNVALANKAKPEGMSMPAKLIISAPKGLLDAVGGGKIDFEAFRQQASVEYLTFGEEKPKSNKQ